MLMDGVDGLWCIQPSATLDSKVELRVMLPDRNVATVKVPKNSTTADVYQVVALIHVFVRIIH